MENLDLGGVEATLVGGDERFILERFWDSVQRFRRVITYNGRGFDVPFLHGGVPAKTRDAMVQRFQEDADAPPVFLLSLKAGGTGLNLTRASHVFHYDHWWNPAVESQATDRAHRIGQTRTVYVHRLVSQGTLEEKIAQMLDEKKGLANLAYGDGEQWLTELADDPHSPRSLPGPGI